ncbi:hypothetical protein ElyMa_003742500 [Elysia marginata]|uniref:RRM domain-containing protein n=1 Tax=Elysia marginata TaxID=1093978 RepID=A0AAV4F692_9GAST|nr:hypothetical protein ElyMa_003742500 [Elysia marginata]
MRGPQPQQMRGPQPQQMRGPQPQQIRGPQLQQIRNPQAQLRGNQPQQFSSVSNQFQQPQGIQQRPRGQLLQNLSNPPQLITGAQPGVHSQQRLLQPNQMTGPPPPQQIISQPPQQIGGPRLQQQLRGPPNQPLRGSQQTFQGPGPQQLRGPPPQQPALHQVVKPPASLQVNPVQHQLSQLRGPPPVASQPQHMPPSVGYQAPTAPPAQSRFITPPSFPGQQQQLQSGYDAGSTLFRSIPQGGIVIQPPPAQVQLQFSGPPPQQPHSSSQYLPVSSASSESAHNYNFSHQGNSLPQPTYQNYAPPQPEYQTPGVPLYSDPYPSASSSQTNQSVAPSYQYSQVDSQYTSPPYGSGRPVSTYQNNGQNQQRFAPQQGQASILPSQTASYSSSIDYYASPQPIQTIQAVSNQTTYSAAEDQYQSAEGQKIQTIGQHIQPVTGTQMRSIIHNVATSPKSSSTPARSVQQRTPTLHISRAVMEGNVPVLPGSQKVIILNVPQMATRETLIRLCRHFGHVEGVNLMRDQNKAVVQFQKGDQAAKCVSKCDQKCLHKTRLTVKLLPS